MSIPDFPRVEATAYVKDDCIYLQLRPHPDVQPFPCRFSVSNPEARRLLRSLQAAIEETHAPCIHSTPPKEFDGVTVGLKLIETAVEMIDIAQDARGEPWDTSEYLQEAANLVHDAWLAIQTAYGRALSEEAAKREQSGYRQCVRCNNWRPEAETVRLSSCPGAKDQSKVSHWIECKSCLGIKETEGILQNNEEEDVF